jgi:hypothetical protein
MATTVAENSIALPMSAKALVMKDLNRRIPINDFGLPEFIYRADLIPGNLSLMPTEEQADHTAIAKTTLDYSQGYPVQENAEPFWGQLQNEPMEAYRAFKQYLDLPRPSEKEVAAAPVRQLHLLRTIVSMSTEELISCCHLYYWISRAQAYDLFVTASHAKRKEIRIMDVEEQHYELSKKYIAFADAVLEQMFETDLETGRPQQEFKPKEVIELMKLMMQMQRVSSGATPFGSSVPSSKDPNSLPPNASLEVILRTIASKAGLAGSAKGDSDQELLLALESDPDTMKMAQELIIRVDKNKNPRINTFNSEVIDHRDTGV